MTLTRSFKDTIMARAKIDSEFRAALLTEAVNCLLSGDIDTGKCILRDYLNATGSFKSVAEALNKNDKSIRRMLGPGGNPTLTNFIGVLNECSKLEQIRLQVEAVPPE